MFRQPVFFRIAVKNHMTAAQEFPLLLPILFGSSVLIRVFLHIDCHTRNKNQLQRTLLDFLAHQRFKGLPERILPNNPNLHRPRRRIPLQMLPLFHLFWRPFGKLHKVVNKCRLHLIFDFFSRFTRIRYHLTGQNTSWRTRRGIGPHNSRQEQKTKHLYTNNHSPFLRGTSRRRTVYSLQSWFTLRF